MKLNFADELKTRENALNIGVSVTLAALFNAEFTLNPLKNTKKTFRRSMYL